MASYSLPRGTTWSILVSLTKNGAPVNLLGHRLLSTVRLTLVDGTVDSSSPPVWQGDSSASGIVVAIPSSTTTWSSGASVALDSFWQPTASNANGCFYEVTNAGSGHASTTEPSWPVPSVAAPFPSTNPDANGVVWTFAGFVNQATVTMPPSATQALPNPVSGTTKLYYDVVDDDGAGGIWQTEDGIVNMTPRTTLSQP